MNDDTAQIPDPKQKTIAAVSGGHLQCRILNAQDPLVSTQITLPKSMHKELFLAVQEIFHGCLERTQQLDQNLEDVRDAAMSGLEILGDTLDRHKGCGQTIRVARFLAAIYNGYEYSFDLIDLRALDTRLANACLAYLNYDRLGIDEVHHHLPGGGAQLNMWLAESGLKPRSQRNRRRR